MAEFFSVASHLKFDPYSLTVGVTEVAFPTASSGTTVKQPEKIYVVAPSTNTGRIVIGKTGIASDFSVGGFVLEPGDNGVLPVNCDELLYAISNIAAQKLLVVYLGSSS